MSCRQLPSKHLKQKHKKCKHVKNEKQARTVHGRRFAKRFSGELRQPPLLSFNPAVFCLLSVLVWRHAVPPLVQDKHTPKCQNDIRLNILRKNPFCCIMNMLHIFINLSKGNTIGKNVFSRLWLGENM